MNDSLVRLLFLMHLASTLFMVGLIWFVQVVHYPLFAQTGTSAFTQYEQTHTRLTARVVAPIMLVEVGSGLLLLWFRPSPISNLQCVTGLILLGVIWLSTLFIQIPCHDELSKCFDPVVHRRLVSTNWLRTAVWSLRGLLVLWMVWSMTSDYFPPLS